MVRSGAPFAPASSTSVSASPSSAITWRQAPQGEAGGEAPDATATARMRRAPAATAAAIALRSAQTVSP